MNIEDVKASSVNDNPDEYQLVGSYLRNDSLEWL